MSGFDTRTASILYFKMENPLLTASDDILAMNEVARLVETCLFSPLELTTSTSTVSSSKTLPLLVLAVG